MTIEEAIQKISDLWDYSIIKCWPQNEQNALKFAMNFMKKHKDDDEGHDYSSDYIS